MKSVNKKKQKYRKNRTIVVHSKELCPKCHKPTLVEVKGKKRCMNPKCE